MINHYKLDQDDFVDDLNDDDPNEPDNVDDPHDSNPGCPSTVGLCRSGTTWPAGQVAPTINNFHVLL